ncbi:class II aldolase/adducin N-terminal [Coniella lustricola]|uniref:Methylthioribulose-1-phosphate dehydratase n=1 Tax=Coniella lustricola TaxID=2025994 RepID=A0A2T3AMP3_9PEZI|nr:class II aldolase/adducin N-terminal [Coniella lustricola]
MSSGNDELVRSDNPDHPANLIPSLCAKFWTLGWVTGTGGGASIRDGDLVYLAPSGVQKELMKPSDLYSDGPIRPASRVYLRSPPVFKPSQCTPLFLSAFTRKGARCCIHTHSPYAVLVTLILEQQGKGKDKEFRINNIEQIKGFARGYPHGEVGNLGYHDTLRIPIIENTAHEEDLTEFLEDAMDRYPDAYAVLVRRHGVYVWGNSVEQAKGQCESLDYLFHLAVEMQKLGIPWMSEIEPTLPTRSLKD